MELKNVSRFDPDMVQFDFHNLLDEHEFQNLVGSLVWGSVEYTRGTILELSSPVEEKPIFCEIRGLATKNQAVYVFAKRFLNSVFCENLCAYRCTSFDYSVILFNEIPYRLICPSHNHGGQKYIIRKHAGRLQSIL